MAHIEWDQTSERFFEAGVDHCVLYMLEDGAYVDGVAWNGITQISESPEGAELNEFWADNIKYGGLRSAETFGATIEAYTYPDEFAECDGSAVPVDGIMIGQQTRKKFGLCYRTTVGNDEKDLLGYKIHLVYGCSASPSSKDYATINDSPEAITFSWEMDTIPVTVEKVANAKPTSTVVIDTTKLTTEFQKTALAQLEAALYGVNPVYAEDGETVVTAGSDPHMPLPDDVIDMFTPTTPEDDEDGE